MELASKEIAFDHFVTHCCYKFREGRIVLYDLLLLQLFLLVAIGLDGLILLGGLHRDGLMMEPGWLGVKP